jgi:hypothetical protein
VADLAVGGDLAADEEEALRRGDLDGLGVGEAGRGIDGAVLHG